MILASHGIIGSQILQIDPDYLAFYNRVIAAGGSLTSTEQAATEQLVKDLKADGIWTKMKAIYPMVGASAAACAQNLRSSSFTGTFTSGWTFASTGITPNGTSAYMDTGLNPRTSLTFANTHISIYSRTNSAISANSIGVSEGGGTFLPIYSLAIRISGDTVQYDAYDYTTHRMLSSNNSSLGFFIGNVSSSTSQKLYKNSNILGTITAAQTETQLPNYNFWIATRNDANSGGAFDSREYAFSSIGDGLTDAEASDFYDAVQAFQTTLARQV